ncbi:hypothetical protein Vadar_012659 [Vaccinium darrowii]|uniref:Uncharacterized protein n=1 Tax=Vaccinium darrowii TaxID=229202 RepID=A0ACB7ZJ60_9ERIC|nr:hypothetical protein Vadar_012659 [Vaccinium darrowii]
MSGLLEGISNVQELLDECMSFGLENKAINLIEVIVLSNSCGTRVKSCYDLKEAETRKNNRVKLLVLGDMEEEFSTRLACVTLFDYSTSPGITFDITHDCQTYTVGVDITPIATATSGESTVGVDDCRKLFSGGFAIVKGSTKRANERTFEFSCEKGAYMFELIDLCVFVLEHPIISRFHVVLLF